MRPISASHLLLLLLASLLSLSSADVASWTVSNSLPSSVFTSAVQPEPISPFLATGSGPHATNQFWTNFVLGDGSFPVVQLPYVLQAAAGGLGVTYPDIHAELDAVTASRVPEFVITAQEPLNSHRVTDYTELSVQLSFPSTLLDSSSSISFPIVRGAPYVTAVCDAITPVLNFIENIVGVNSYARGAQLTDTRFLLQMQDDRMWVLYSSEPVTLLFRDAQTLLLVSPFTGVLRLAAVPSQELLYSLDQHAAVYPISASVNYTVSNYTADIFFDFVTAGGDENSTELFMLALPHHFDTLISPAVDTAAVHYTTFASLKGEMREVYGSTWQMRESLPDLDWYAARDPNPAYVASLRESLKTDAARLAADSTDPYWLGRELASIARLSLIAESISENDTARRCRDFVKSKLSHTLNSFAADAMLYESRWGGIVTRNSLYASVCDNGLGWYRNHLAQYGELIYSAAVVNKADGNIWADDTTRYAQEFLVRDLINPSSADTAFPVTRQKDWYEGHSWGLGLEHNMNGKSLDSVSESAHAYYAVYLWAVAAGNQRVADLAHVLCATEMRAARRYWQMPSFRSVYDPVFSANKFVDSLSSLAVSASKQTMMHAMARQMRPISPLLPFILYRPVVQDSYVQIRNALLRSGDLSGATQSYAYVALALLQPDESFADLAALAAFDYAETRTNLLYWAATRLEYDNSTLPRVPSVSPSYSQHFELVVDFAPASAAASSVAPSTGGSFVIDSGAPFSDAAAYGWVRGEPKFSARTLSVAYSAHFSTFARFDKSTRWKAVLPSAGDYLVRVALVPPTGSDKCSALSMHATATDDAVIGTVGRCPEGGETMALWSGVVTTPRPELVLSGEMSADVAYLEVTTADGSYLNMDFADTSAKSRDTVRLPSALNEYLLSAALSAVAAQPADRFYVRSLSNTHADVLVLDSRNYPGAASSYDVAMAVQRAPLPIWTRSGISINSIAVSGAPSPVSPPSPSEGPREYKVPAVVIALTVILGASFIVGSIVAIVYLLRKRSIDAAESSRRQQEFKVIAASHSQPGSAAGSQVDLLQRTQSRGSLHTISPTTSATAITERAATDV